MMMTAIIVSFLLAHGNFAINVIVTDCIIFILLWLDPIGLKQLEKQRAISCLIAELMIANNRFG